MLVDCIILDNAILQSVIICSVIDGVNEQVNPSLSSGDAGNQEESAKRVSGGGGVAAARRPGLMRTTFDEWDTLLVRETRDAPA